MGLLVSAVPGEFSTTRSRWRGDRFPNNEKRKFVVEIGCCSSRGPESEFSHLIPAQALLLLLENDLLTMGSISGALKPAADAVAGVGPMQRRHEEARGGGPLAVLSVTGPASERDNVSV